MRPLRMEQKVPCGECGGSEKGGGEANKARSHAIDSVAGSVGGRKCRVSLRLLFFCLVFY